MFKLNRMCNINEESDEEKDIKDVVKDNALAAPGT